MNKVRKPVLVLGTLLLMVSCITVHPSVSSSTNNTSNDSSSSHETSDYNTNSDSSSTQSSSEDNSSSLDSSLSSSSSSSKSSSSFSTSYDQNEFGGYYSSINFNSTGDNLVKALGSLITSTHNPKSYDALWEGYKLGDLKPGTNYLWDMYSNCDYDADDAPKGNYSKEGDAVNREHSVPQSWFSEKSPMKSDYYHVVPTDGYVNNRRSNYPFGEVGSPKYTSQNGSKVGPSSVSGISETVFEPIDEYKGDFARIYFYMCTRYYTQVGSWSGGVFQGTYPYLKSSYFQLYLKWAKDDPVSDKERQRNEGGYIFQGNRNPYVDFPQLLYQAFDDGYILEEESDQEKAQRIINLIDDIGEVTLSSRSKIEAARSAYDSATEEVKKLVTNYNVLLQAEKDYKELVENSSSEMGPQTSCEFTNKNFANSLNYAFTSSVDPYGYEGDRGVQFLAEGNITITSSSYPFGISQITIDTSSNKCTYSYEVSVNGVALSCSANSVSSGERNKKLVFLASAPINGELKIKITTSTPEKSLWIKSIQFN